VITPDKQTISVREADVEKKWWVVDADGQTVGRIASQIARVLRGKHKPLFTPHVDCGDNVIVINAEKVVMAPKRAEQKEYSRYTGYPGGRRVMTYQQMLETRPERILEHAVLGMLPKNRLGKRIGKKLHIYAGDQHPHQAQQPQPIEFKTK
jgi:large subunit ribosomal protein L13